MQRVYKYPLVLMEEQSLRMPIGAIPLCVQLQDDIICLWAQVEPDAETEQWDIYVISTGQDMYNADSANAGYVGTVQQGSYVWHVFIQRTK